MLLLLLLLWVRGLLAVLPVVVLLVLHPALLLHPALALLIAPPPVLGIVRGSGPRAPVGLPPPGASPRHGRHLLMVPVGIRSCKHLGHEQLVGQPRLHHHRLPLQQAGKTRVDPGRRSHGGVEHARGVVQPCAREVRVQRFHASKHGEVLHGVATHHVALLLALVVLAHHRSILVVPRHGLSRPLQHAVLRALRRVDVAQPHAGLGRHPG